MLRRLTAYLSLNSGTYSAQVTCKKKVTVLCTNQYQKRGLFISSACDFTYELHRELQKYLPFCGLLI